MLTAVTLLSSVAVAQVPSSVETGRVQADLDHQFNDQIKIKTSEAASAPTVQAPAGAEDIKFTLNGITIEGATSIEAEKLNAIYNDKIGQEISLTTIYDIANQITLEYRNRGYLLSRAIVPEQEIDSGTVKIKVVEGFISGYHITGNSYGAKRQIEDYALRLLNAGALTAQKLERYLLLINDLPGISARGVLSPSENTDGGADITIIVEQDDIEFFASVDNFGNRYLGEMRGTAGFQVNSLFNGTDKINGTYLIAPDHQELSYFSIGYKQNISDNGTTAGIGISHTLTNPTLPLSLGGNLGSEGDATTLSFELDHPFIRSRSLNVFGGVDFDLSTNKTNYAPAFVALETEEKTRVLRAHATTTYLDGFSGYNIAHASMSRGLEIFGSSKGGEGNLSRALGEPNFFKINIDASRLQRLYGPINILVGVTGQWSKDPLLASEEFGIGGTEFGRGYDSSEITGDHGIAGKVELSYNKVVEKAYLNNYQVYGFYDVGSTWDKDPGAGVSPRASIASIGIGTRFGFTDNVKGNAFIALPLINGATSRGNEADNIRFKFSLTTNF